jgi:hypothetical protein
MLCSKVIRWNFNGLYQYSCIRIFEGITFQLLYVPDFKTHKSLNAVGTVTDACWNTDLYFSGWSIHSHCEKPLPNISTRENKHGRLLSLHQLPAPRRPPPDFKFRMRFSCISPLPRSGQIQPWTVSRIMCSKLSFCWLQICSQYEPINMSELQGLSSVAISNTHHYFASRTL